MSLIEAMNDKLMGKLLQNVVHQGNERQIDEEMDPKCCSSEQ
ncbi:hypothetical protein P5G51_017185 [Virgibacillus sp. 179-BFC.A HS]|uniref:Uncharacterized protein n=1 Tax=Tigheibacillus jepli TaxID=3035914 RepID=A0ABU5CKH2_9BACI|nr:hypothetical protein [Virgibacillus sp. 179-BFC.A HS]MDY0406858.1 hypothetical protein [Virgibacillus sp. 179-BFC.A HS]